MIEFDQHSGQISDGSIRYILPRLDVPVVLRGNFPAMRSRRSRRRNRIEGAGYYMQPTVLADVTPQMSVVREEIFAPVLVARRFADEADVHREANDNDYGLGASIWTRDINRAHRFIEGFKAGTVWANTHNVLDAVLPFGGVKSSGLGHDLGEDAIRENLQIKSTVIRHS